jgi:hypothetical protein
VALAPSALMTAAFAGVQSGAADWRGWPGRAAMDWAPPLIYAAVLVGIGGLVLALLAGFRRYWKPALAVLALTAAALAFHIALIQAPAARQAFVEQGLTSIKA